MLAGTALMTSDRTAAVLSRNFEEQVTRRSRGVCANCGGDQRLRVRMVVPEEAGGQKVESNGILLCRACELAWEASMKPPGSEGAKDWPMNFLVSNRLYDLMERLRDGQYGSFAALIRMLIHAFVRDPDRFDDLAQFQDSGSDSKINIWIPTALYQSFQRLVNERGLSVTDAVKGLVLMVGDGLPR